MSVKKSANYKSRNSGKKHTHKNSQRKAIVRTASIIATVIVLLLIIILLINNSSSRIQGSAAAKVGQLAPNGALTEVSGATIQISSLRGSKTLLWFVTTWCSSCEAGTQVMDNYVTNFEQLKVKIVEVELYNDLGQSGPSMASFGSQLAGKYFNSPSWIFATASKDVTNIYDPKSYLDIYYLINSSGKITYVNSSPADTMTSLLSQATELT